MNPRRILWQMLHSGAFFAIYTVSRLMLALALGKGMSSHAYGTYSLIGSLAAVLPALLSISAFQYYTREVPGRSPEQGATVFKSVVAVQVLLLTGFCVFVSIFPGSRAWAENILGIPGQWELLLFAAAIFLTDSLATDLMRYLFAQCQIERGNLVAFLQTSLWPLVLFAAAMRGVPMTLQLVLMAWFLSAATAALVGLMLAGAGRILRAPIRLDIYWEAIRFSMPYVLSYAPLAVQAFSRFFISGIYSTEAVGIFAYQFNIITMIGAIAGPVFSAPLEPYITQAFNQGNPTRSGNLLSLTAKYRLAAVIPMLAVAAIYHEPLIQILAKRDFVAVPWLMASLAFVPLGMTLSATFERVLFLQRKTRTIGFCYAGAAAIQALLVPICIPLHPQYGPALAINAGVLAQMLLMWVNARKETVPLRIGWAPMALSALIAVLLAFLTERATHGLANVYALLIGAAVVGIGYLISLYLLNILSVAERQALVSMLRHGKQRLLSLAGGRN